MGKVFLVSLADAKAFARVALTYHRYNAAGVEARRSIPVPDGLGYGVDVLSISEMVAREQEAFAAGTTAEKLMESAGAAMGARIAAAYPRATDFLVLAGKGNNGGDGLVVARVLAAAGKPVRVILAAQEDKLGELSQSRLARLRREFFGVPISAWSADVAFPASTGVVIDALLGVQAKGELRGNLANVVARLNEARAERFFRTVALDLPTGLAAYADGSLPREKNAAVIADVTLAVGFAKEVLCREALAGWVGRLEIVPWSTHAKESTRRQALVPHELAGLLPRRGAASYKNDFGKLAIVAGRLGFTGAPVLCVQAAQAVGAGLLSVVTHADAQPIVAAHAPPEAMVSAWRGTRTPEAVAGASVIAIGPGLGTGASALRLLRGALAVDCPKVVDADGLTLLAAHPDLFKEAKGPLVLTPHVGEMHRLIGRKFTPDEREEVATAFVEQHDVTLVLKGTRTLVTARGARLFLNTTGNPGLSTGGSGDTLTGIIAGLLAQKLKPLDAARLGVWLHGHAADLVLAERGCEEGLTPSMLSAQLGPALVSLRAQSVVTDALLAHAG
jgi:NAD(P)H-hydrate epimerase